MGRKFFLSALVAAISALVPVVIGSGAAREALPCGNPTLNTACGTVNFVYDTACFTPLAEAPVPASPDIVVKPTLKCPELPALPA